MATEGDRYVDIRRPYAVGPEQMIALDLFRPRLPAIVDRVISRTESPSMRAWLAEFCELPPTI